MTTIPSPDVNDPRIAEMINEVDRVMDLCREGKMAEAITDERGSLSYFCKECQFVGVFILENEDHFVAPDCEKCQSKRTTIGNRKGISTVYRLKD